MADFVLRPRKQKAILRGLLLASPIFLFHPLMQVIRGFLVPGLPNPMDAFMLWVMGAPYFYVFSVLACYFERFKIKNGILSYGMLGMEKIPLTRIAEVAGDEGDIGNDFKESILIKFDRRDSERGLVLPTRDYEEHELRGFLSAMREENPAGEYSYSDVIPFESRGLIRFLWSVGETDSMILKLSKTPLEDAIISLVKSHERIFWCVYLAFWLLLLFAASYYCVMFNAAWTLNPGVTPHWDISARTTELAQLLEASRHHPDTSFLDSAYLNAALTMNIGLDYLSTTGLTVMTSLWMLGGFVMGIFLPIVKFYAPTYLFIDSKSIGVGSEFLTWDEIYQVDLEKPGKMGDPLEGTLVLTPHSGARLNFDLTRVPEIQKRQKILRLVDRYAAGAKFNGDFMRTTNMLVDIQFTDLWLEEQTASAKPEVETELKSLRNDTYRIDSLLGYGGQGVTYLATHQGDTTDGDKRIPDGHVVIKELVLPNYADVRIMQDATSRFERGAQLLKELEHDSVVRLVDSFMENGKAYLVMEYVRGETLREYVERNGALEPEKAMKLAHQLCEILTFLHEREIPVIHCDFAPDNLIVTPDGGVKLIDFDVARVVDSKAHTFIAGRPSYTPPEQFRGQPTIQSDLFALGAMIHFLLQGKDPPPLCAGTNEADHEWHSTDVEELIQRCCQFEAADRPQSAREIKAVLEGLEKRQGEKISIAPRVPELG